MPRLPFLILLLLLQGTSHASGLLITDTHGSTGQTAEAWILIQAAPNAVSEFGFTLAFDANVLAFDRIVAQPNTPAPSWTITTTPLPVLSGNRRTAISASASLPLASTADHFLFRVRFLVLGNATATIGIEDLALDMAGWDVTPGRFTSPSADDDCDTEIIANCFMDTLQGSP